MLSESSSVLDHRPIARYNCFMQYLYVHILGYNLLCRQCRSLGNMWRLDNGDIRLERSCPTPQKVLAVFISIGVYPKVTDVMNLAQLRSTRPGIVLFYLVNSRFYSDLVQEEAFKSRFTPRNYTLPCDMKLKELYIGMQYL